CSIKEETNRKMDQASLETHQHTRRSLDLPEQIPEEEPAEEVTATELWPEPLSIEDTRISVEPLRPEMLPASLAGWLCDVAGRMGVPLDFPAAAGIVGLLAAVGGGAWIPAKRVVSGL